VCGSGIGFGRLKVGVRMLLKCHRLGGTEMFVFTLTFVVEHAAFLFGMSAPKRGWITLK
jgi:hypothetical protein